MNKNVFLYLLVWANLISAQNIVDNKYAFGFENVFNWNVIANSGQVVDGEELRLVFYDNLNSIKDSFLLCAVKKMNSEEFKKLIEQIESNDELIKNMKLQILTQSLK